jgi:hypothetical protein
MIAGYLQDGPLGRPTARVVDVTRLGTPVAFQVPLECPKFGTLMSFSNHQSIESARLLALHQEVADSSPPSVLPYNGLGNRCALGGLARRDFLWRSQDYSLLGTVAVSPVPA